MVPIIEKPVFNLYLDMLCVRPDRANGGVGGCGSSHKSVIGRMGWQLFLSIFLILLLLACLGFQIRTIWEQMRLNELREGSCIR